MSFESPQDNNTRSKSEGSFEREAESIAEEQGSLVERTFVKAMDVSLQVGSGKSREEWREVLAQGTDDPTTRDDIALKAVELLEKVPFLGPSFKMFEAGMGVDIKSGKKIETKEAITRYGVGLVRFATNFGDTFLSGEQGKFTLSGKTLGFFEKLSDSSSKEDPDSKKAKAASAIRDFMRTNKDQVENFEKFVEQKIREVAK